MKRKQLIEDEPFIMLDLETLSQEKDAAVISIAAIPFDRVNVLHGVEPFYKNILVEDCIKNKMRVSKETIDWWAKQDKNILKRTMQNRVSLKGALEELSDYCSVYTSKKGVKPGVFGNGSSFDIPIIWNAYRAENMLDKYPFDTWREYCYRTVMATFGVTKKQLVEEYGGFEAHDPVEDCKFQVRGLLDVLEAVDLVDRVPF